MSFLGSFDYTKGSAWGGTQISPLLLQVAAIVGGVLALDHFLLRSPQTALLKILFNVLTLGLWYWYDVIQSYSDIEFVKEYGYSLPFLGPVGIGQGIVHKGDGTGPSVAPESSPKPYMFLVYALLILIPFGFSNFLVGDKWGGLLKFILSVNIFTFMLGWIWAIYSTVYMYLYPKELFTKGTDHPFPISIFLGKNGSAPGLTMPEKQPIEIQSGFSLTSLFPFLAPIEEFFLSGLVKTGEVVENSAEIMKKTSEQLKTIENTVEKVQSGGGAAFPSEAIFFGTAILILVGSLVTTFLRFRKGSKNKQPEKDNDIPPETDDGPPSGPRIL